MKKLILILFAAILVIGCDQNDARVASYNISKEAEMFRVDRRVVFYDAIQGRYLLSIEGKCSVEANSTRLEVTCKTGDMLYKKHYLGISDNVTWFAEQLHPKGVSVYHYKVIFKPKAILPDVELVN